MLKGSDKNLGGTMRLGLYDAILKNNSLISKIDPYSSINSNKPFTIKSFSITISGESFCNEWITFIKYKYKYLTFLTLILKCDLKKN